MFKNMLELIQQVPLSDLISPLLFVSCAGIYAGFVAYSVWNTQPPETGTEDTNGGIIPENTSTLTDSSSTELLQRILSR